MGLPPGVTLVPMPQAPPPAPPTPAAAAPSGPPPGVSLIPMPQASTTAPAAPTANDLTSNPNAEGVYGMQGPKGESMQVPYSKVSTAQQQGYQLQGGSNWYGAPQGDAGRYARDYAADPNQIKATTQYAKDVQDPGQGMVTGAVKQGEKTVAGLMKILGDNRDQSSAALRSVGVPGQSASPEAVAPDPVSDHLLRGAAWLNQNTDADGFFEHLGGFGENVAELLTPEALGVLAKGSEVVKGGEVADQAVSAAQKYSDAAKVAKTLDTFPRIRALVGLGLAAAGKAGVEVGAQTYAKTGGDTDTALQAGGIAAVTGAGLAGVVAPALRAGIEHISPTVEDIGGVPVTRLGSQNPHASVAQTLAATAEHSPIVQQAQQQAGQEIVANSAKSAAEQHLGEVNEGRVDPNQPATVVPKPYQFRIQGTPAQETTEGNIAQTPRKQQIGTRVVEGKGPSERQVYPDASGEQQQVDVRPNGDDGGTDGSHRAPTYRMLPESKAGSVAKRDVVTGGGVLTTEDPATAKAAIGSLNDAIDSPEFANQSPEQQQAILDHREDLQRQMSEYHASTAGQQPSLYASRSTFAPVDISRTVAKVGSFGDAADALEDSATEVYNRLDDLTGGRFSALRDENKRAWSAVANGGGDAAQARLADTQQKLDAMFSGKDPQVGDSVSHSDLAFGNEAWKKSQVLRDVHSKIESAFDTSIGASDRANAYRGFNGNRLRGALKQLTMKYGDRPLGRIIGGDQLDNLSRLADITRTQADRAKFGAGVNHIAQWMTRNEGKVAGAVGAAGGAVGHLVGGAEGAAYGAGAAEVAYAAGRRVMRAIATNPRVGKNFIFAIQAGARPLNYAPLIGAMVRENDQDQGGQTQ